MKLYTEEQLRIAIAMGFDWCHQKNIPSDYMIDTFIKQLTPIELPSDEEIDEIGKYVIVYNDTKRGWFIEGLKFMRNKIQGGNK